MKSYFVDTSKKVTPAMVRDAIIECFTQAHSEVLASMKEYHEFKTEKEFEEMKHLDIEMRVRWEFKDIGADYDNPSKKDLIAVIGRLAEYAANYRKPEIVKAHYAEIMQLIDRL